MSGRRRFAVGVTSLLALLGVAAAILWPAGAAPAAAQSAGPAVVCFEITVGWRICVAPGGAPAERAPTETPGPCATGVAVPDAANNPGLVADCAILLAAKDTLRGTAALNWGADRAITAWDWVTVSGTPPRVTELDLGSRGLTGTIPPELGALARLQWLWLSGNRLTGPIPPELGNLAQLRILRLQQNRLTGAIPPELGTLALLKTLWLGVNRLTGAIPPELGNLARLEWLSLYGNRLTGPIPPELGDLTHLTHLGLHGNRLTGAIPPELGALARLDHLTLSQNRLTGAIPPELGNLAQLRSLALRENRLTGAIPPELGDLEKLEWLYLFGNRLTGTIPAALGSLGELEILYLHYNQLTGSIPPEFGALSSLGWLGLNNNQLSGPIPVELTTLPALQDLYLDQSQLSGPIPAGLVDRNLRALYLGGNSGLTGCIPAGLRSVRYKDLDSLSLSYCTTTTTYLLTTTAGAGGSTSPLPGTYRYLSGTTVTVTATPDPYYNIGTWGGDCSGTLSTCTLTMDAAKTASVSFQIQTYALTVTATGGGTVSPSGTTTQNGGTELTLTASWNDATHSFAGWGGDCSGTLSTCTLLMDAAKTVTATFAALPTDRCATTTAADCIRAVYRGAPGDYAQITDIPADKLLTPGSDGRYQVERGQQITVVSAAPLPTGYTRFYLQRRPPGVAGTPAPVSFTQLIKPVGTTYTFTVTSDERGRTLFTFDLQAAKPPLRPGLKPQLGDRVVTTTFQVTTKTLRYTSYDTTGAATTRGSYAFLTGSGTDESAVTTYEALRDGTATGLRIHQSDGYGASQTDTYSGVAVGDIFEWREADDCFVRYEVTEVKADPAGTVPRKHLLIEPMTYAFTGCSGTVAANAAASFAWGPLLDLGGPSLAAPVRHGPYQLVPEDWTGAVEAPESHYPTSYSPFTTPIYMADPDPAVASELPYWREPTLPAGWALHTISRGTVNDPPFGYTASYSIPGGWIGVRIEGYYAVGRGWAEEASWSDGGGVYETRMIHGRPARVMYSPPGLNHDPLFPLTVWVYDPVTQTEYAVYGYAGILLGDKVDAVIAIARSLFESPNPP